MRTTTAPRTRIASLGALGLAIAATLAGCGGSDGSSSNGTSSTSSSASAGTGTGATASSIPAASEAAADRGATTDQATKALTQINAVRAVARNCGAVAFAATSSLSWNSKLESAAASQSQYMQSNNSLTHTGPGDSTVGDRVTAAGYTWSRVGENIAVGYGTVEDVMQGWVDSPGHCANLMNPNFKVVAVALNAGSNDDYWTMDLAAP